MDLEARNLPHKMCSCALQQGEVLDKIEGANAAALTQAVRQHFSQTSTSKPQAAAASAPTSSTPANGVAMTPASSEERIKKLMSSQPVMLFMKVGHSTAPLDWSLPHTALIQHVNPMTMIQYSQSLCMSLSYNCVCRGRDHQMRLAAASAGRWWMHLGVRGRTLAALTSCLTRLCGRASRRSLTGPPFRSCMSGDCSNVCL